MIRWVSIIALAASLHAAEIVDVTCQDDPSQRYALYVPSNYTPDHAWKLILAFDPGARGRTPVERFQAAAEKYGYMVAGSYNSRNGPWEPALKAGGAMMLDVSKRYHIDVKRIYTTGQSGGARLAMLVAMSGSIAGVIASSAGFPDSTDSRKVVPFPIFGTAGTEDFNYLEMRKLDEQLTSPHRIEIFTGRHSWLPAELAMQGVEWMELQALKKAPAPRDEALLKKLFEIRVAALAAVKGDLETWRALTNLVTDFKGLEGIEPFSTRAAALYTPAVKAAHKHEMDVVNHEIEVGQELYQLTHQNGKMVVKDIGAVRKKVEKYIQQAKAPEDSEQRQLARRILSGFVNETRGLPNPEFQKLLNEMSRP